MSEQNRKRHEPVRPWAGGTVSGQRRAGRSVGVLALAGAVVVASWSLLGGGLQDVGATMLDADVDAPFVAVAPPPVTELTPWDFVTSHEHLGTVKTLSGTTCQACHGNSAESESTVAGWSGPPPLNHREGVGCSACHNQLHQQIERLGLGLDTHPPLERDPERAALVGVHPDFDWNSVSSCSTCHALDSFLPTISREIHAAQINVPGASHAEAGSAARLAVHQEWLTEAARHDVVAADSCYQCHSYEYMDASLQDRQARRRHSEEYREATGRTCSQCHQAGH